MDTFYHKNRNSTTAKHKKVCRTSKKVLVILPTVSELRKNPQITEFSPFARFFARFLRFSYNEVIVVSKFYHLLVKICCQTLA